MFATFSGTVCVFYLLSVWFLCVAVFWGHVA